MCDRATTGCIYIKTSNITQYLLVLANVAFYYYYDFMSSVFMTTIVMTSTVAPLILGPFSAIAVEKQNHILVGIATA